MDIVHWLLAAVGVGGGCAAVAYLAFKFLAAKWLENKFAERLEAYKHQQQKELEQLKFQINASFDRLTKLHQHEFQVLPDAWGVLVNAFVEAKAFVASLQSYPDLETMKPAHLAEFVEACPLAPWQKEELKATPKIARTNIIKKVFSGIPAAMRAKRPMNVTSFCGKTSRFSSREQLRNSFKR